MPDQALEVRWTESAARALEEIVAFIGAESPGNAARVLARLEARARGLEVLPLRGRAVPELAFVGITRWRELVDAPYRLVYRCDGPIVYVIGVFDGRRDLQDVLLERLLRG